MRGAVLVALAATIGNFLQGWDNATIAGSVLYIKKELDLSTAMEGLVVAMSLIGATVITTCSGAISDAVGRRPMLILSASLYFIGSLVMLWSPNVYILLLARLLDGFGIGLAVTLVPVYISETSPPEIRGFLNTLPQFTGSGGMFLSYCLIFAMSLKASPSWRIMLGVLGIPSVFYLLFAIFYLPESPRWLVSKGRMSEAKTVLKRLRGTDDISGELTLLVEGLGGSGETSIEEYFVEPAEEQEPASEKDKIKLFEASKDLSWNARPVNGHSAIGLVSHHGSMLSQNLVDPLVTLFGSVHESSAEIQGSRSAILPNYGSMINTVDALALREPWDEENQEKEDDDNHQPEPARGGEDSDNDLTTPLIHQTTSSEKEMDNPVNNGSTLSMGNHGSLIQPAGETVAATGIGGGWQMAWTVEEKEDEDGKKSKEFKRMYLHHDAGPNSMRGSVVSLAGGDIAGEEDCYQASALVSNSAIQSKELLDQFPVGPAMVHPAEIASQGPIWKALLEPGVKRALIVGIGIQMLQQFAGINGVLYYTPQILEEAGVEVLLSDLGISSTSSSFLISALTTFLMLPCIGVAMKLMDLTGRRSLLLYTIPVLIASLITLVISCTVEMDSVTHAVISTICVIVYFCTFVMAYGPIPNILCSEIFPTRVRGVCIAICALVFWICDIIVTYSLPVMLNSIGLGGVFAIYAGVCVISLLFVYLKVPETKGMPLEVITEFFTVGTKQLKPAKSE
ncbi:Monosaccharide-sensing protein 2 [Bienertia sinuspersici]